MNLQSYLDDLGVHYSFSRHAAVFSAQALAEVEHVSGRQVIKPVIVKADGRFILCALPASYRLDLAKMRELLQAEEISLVDEPVLGRLFPDCELGAEPPIGKMYGLQTFVDATVFDDDRVMFQAGDHESAVTMRMSDYRRVTGARVAQFSRGG